MGHKVTIVTNAFRRERVGLFYLPNGIKVYNLPQLPVIAGSVGFLSMWQNYPVFRQLFIREQIDIVHGHQGTSSLQLIGISAAKIYGLKTVFTEHSLFGFNDWAGISLNKIAKWNFRNLDQAITVSHIAKENYCMRCKHDPNRTFVIPNAVDTAQFFPDESRFKAMTDNETIKIVYVSRLQYRKGVDLLIGVIPRILKQFGNVKFIVGGEGDKMVILREMIKRYNIADRVEVLGMLKPNEVRATLQRGHIFLNTSLTESFCMANLEAACAGLLIVSTNVGGVPEVLPGHMIKFAQPNLEAIFLRLSEAIREIKYVDTSTFHRELSQIYSWQQVAKRTVKVYKAAMKTTMTNQMHGLISSLTFGPIVGTIAVIYACIEILVVFGLELWFPDSEIDCSRPFSHLRWNVNIRDQKHFNHTFKIANSKEHPAFQTINSVELREDKFKDEVPPTLSYDKCAIRFRTPLPTQQLDKRRIDSSKDNDDDIDFVKPYSIKPRLIVPDQVIHFNHFDEETVRQHFR